MVQRDLDPNEVAFFWREKFQGQVDGYKVGDSRVFVHGVNPENDQYKALKVGAAARVHGWQNYDGTGKYAEWGPGDHDMVDVEVSGLSKFQVLASGTTFALEVRLVDQTGGVAGAYELTVIAAGVGEVKASSGDPAYKLVGTASTSGEVTTQIAVRATGWPQPYVANGSVYFKWNRHSGSVEVTPFPETFPRNMHVLKDDPTRFTFFLDRIES